MTNLLSLLLTQTAAPQSQLSIIFWSTILPVLATVVGGLVVFGLTQLGLYLRNLSKTKKWAGYLADFTDIVTHTVQHAETDLKPALLTDLADGKGLTPEAQKNLKSQVMNLIKTQTAPEVIAAVKARVGDGAFETVLSGMVEKAVAALPE